MRCGAAVGIPPWLVPIRAGDARVGDRGQLAFRFALRGAGVERRRVSSMASTSLSTAR